MRSMAQLMSAHRATAEYMERRNAKRDLVDPGLGAGEYNETRLVRVRKVSGAAGGLSTKCSWAYDIYPLEGDYTVETLIQAAVEIVYCRKDVGKYRFAADDTWAMAYCDPLAADPDKPWVLLIVFDEVPDTGPCSGA